MERVDELLAAKRRIAERYRAGLARLPVQCHAESAGVIHSYWMCSILTSQARERDPLRAHLRERGIETRPVFPPVHTMPIYDRAEVNCPVALDLASRGINLPSWPGMGDAAIDEVVQAIRDFYGSA
jgi:perosamine synthetase